MINFPKLGRFALKQVFRGSLTFCKKKNKSKVLVQQAPTVYQHSGTAKSVSHRGTDSLNDNIMKRMTAQDRKLPQSTRASSAFQGPSAKLVIRASWRYFI